MPVFESRHAPSNDPRHLRPPLPSPVSPWFQNLVSRQLFATFPVRFPGDAAIPQASCLEAVLACLTWSRNASRSQPENLPDTLSKRFQKTSHGEAPVGSVIAGTTACRNRAAALSWYPVKPALEADLSRYRYLLDTLAWRPRETPCDRTPKHLPTGRARCYARRALPSPPLPTFFPVKEAAHRTGKSPSSIRRIIYPIIADDQHPDRKHIQPSATEVLRLRTKGENFAWQISDELLQRELPPAALHEQDDAKRFSHAARDADVELLTMLRRELDIKNHQITQQSEMISRQMELISGLTERLREGNVLIGSLQQQLTLPDGSARMKHIVTATETVKTGGGDSAAKKNPKAPKPKRGFFSRMFR